ncbi:ECF RNA polymerase sigma factor SigE [Polystyrenella longa]|uniref:ECF RNA polymerase sigma factor SigE n=1 Tax=Polystyrenella longa TaxID=2528007 RepID=A0A518CLJ1_9PLAN|nr:sigma-70 family RNA polymerase sigma factor [Polystyrenella longa]QDU80086.1 ECF RNA polymerase sigma factor SigE [Polystyrenella longa]
MELFGSFSTGSTDSQLIRGAQAEYDHSWSMLVETYAPLVYQTARKTGLQPDDASDITQDVLLQVYRSLSDFQPRNRGSFRKWIKVITRNKIVDLCRKQHLEVNLRELDELETRVHPRKESNSVFLNKRLAGIREIIAQVRETVSEKSWQAFESMLSEVETSEEIGQRLGMSDAAVRLAKHRILAQFHMKITNKSVSTDDTA